MQEELLRIDADTEGTVVKRVNRFAVEVLIDGNRELAHLHDPGRLKELIYPGNRVLLKRASSPNRKTRWDIVAAWAGHWVLLNSAYHRKIGEEVLRHLFNPVRVKCEVQINSSRLDYLIETEEGKRTWVELKGCTLCIEGTALFPDAPTERGRRHVEELTRLALEGEDALLLILVLRRDAEVFAPNAETDPAFAKAFWKAVKAGVQVLPVKVLYSDNRVRLSEYIPVMAG